MKLDVATLKRVSPLLDEVLDLEHSDREVWLARLETTQADLAPIVRELLAKESLVETNDILQRGPGFGASLQDAPRAAFESGDSVGPYRLIRELGVGGMGEVWLAERSDNTLKRQVAIKLPIISLNRSVLVQRLEIERDILATLNHPNIARLYDAGLTLEGQPYLVLEYVPGQPITEYAEAQGMDAYARIALLRQVTDAISYAHSILVIHRDIKPSNVMVTPEGRAMLLDFGIAKVLISDADTSPVSEITHIGGRALTLQYAAPEQVLNKPIGITTDVWALGVLLYRLMTDTLPFGEGERSTVEHNILTLTPPMPSQCNSGVISQVEKYKATGLDYVILKAIHKDPSQRIQ